MLEGMLQIELMESVFPVSKHRHFFVSKPMKAGNNWDAHTFEQKLFLLPGKMENIIVVLLKCDFPGVTRGLITSSLIMEKCGVAMSPLYDWRSRKGCLTKEQKSAPWSGRRISWDIKKGYHGLQMIQESWQSEHLKICFDFPGPGSYP